MASPSPVLHPKVREHLEPRMSATALAEYLILSADKQEGILHDCRFSIPPIAGANSAAAHALRKYNCDPYRDKNALRLVKDKLTAKSLAPETKPKAKDEALRCIETIQLFELRENSLGLRSTALRKPPPFDPLQIGGVTVSIRPDFLVDGRGERIGAGIIRVAKAPDPADFKREETRREKGDHRREMARYMVAMLQMLLEAQKGELGTVDRDLCFVSDLRLGERIGPAANHSIRLREIRAACRQIEKLWSDITPRKSVLKKKP